MPGQHLTSKQLEHVETLLRAGVDRDTIAAVVEISRHTVDRVSQGVHYLQRKRNEKAKASPTVKSADAKTEETESLNQNEAALLGKLDEIIKLQKEMIAMWRYE